MRLQGKVAVVTGGGSGFGAGICAKFVAEGAKVVVADLNLDGAKAVASALGAATLPLRADVSQAADVRAMLDAAERHFGALDILVNNAGVSWSAPAEDMPFDKWRMVVQTNLDGAFLFSQEAARVMIARKSGGVIINVASIAGLKGAMPNGVHYSAYVASKGGLLALTRELAAKWAQYNIRVNAISPGFFPSRMTEKVIEDKGEAEMAKGIPMQRLGRVGELKGVALFLAASASGYITGQNVVVVDGGRTAV